MNRVRLGAVGYLNARPLVFGLEDALDFQLRFDVPSRCAELLHGGGIDVGLIPSIEYHRPSGASGAHDEYQVVPGLSIASHGEVASVALFTTRAMSDVRSIALDVSSRTSVALVRVLCSRHYGIGPRLASHGPDLPGMLVNCDAALLIGDKALFQPTLVEGVRSRVEKIDLGAVWTAMTGLPFVWAFWAGRRGTLTSSQILSLQNARDAGVAAVDTIAREYFPGSPERQKIGADYLRDNIKYDFGPDERAAVELFYRYAAEAGVVGTPGPLRFFGE
jgi:chorismate dehydratase